MRLRSLFSVIALLSLVLVQTLSFAQSKSSQEVLKFNLNEDGTHYFQFTALNQVWLRYNQSNPGTTAQGVPKDNTFDIGLRRTRFQLFGQVTDKVFLYFQFGQNNFNVQFNTSSNRKLAAFFHDALCEYRLSRGNQVKLGAGLTIANGLSRFSQPSIGTIMTMDVPVFAQATVDQTDEFSRKLSVYARGQVGRFDYRLILSDPFPISSAGTALPAIADHANFSQKGNSLQQQGYLMYQFFEHEGHATPYMTGTYLGKKKVFNIAAGAIYQADAMWRKGGNNDTVYQDMTLLAVETFLDIPLNTSENTAVNAYVGYFNTDYGSNYLRYNGLMNPANGSTLTAANSITGQGPTFGNSYPMFGTGSVIYAQAGYLVQDKFLNLPGKFLPYATVTAAKYDRLNDLWSNTFNVGINYLLNGHKAKFTLDLQNRPTFEVSNNEVVTGKRLNSVVLQYQIFL